MIKTPRIVMLAGEGDSTWIVANSIKAHWPLAAVIVEQPPSRWKLLARRARQVGWLDVLGQAMFMLFAVFQRKLARRRILSILEEHGLSAVQPKDVNIRKVISANSAEAQSMLRELSPDVVVVNGTRILTQATLDSCGTPFVNMHAGITPSYRGVHGAYWALADGRPDLCGVTVHLVNSGIDTGGILYQTTIEPGVADCFSTYPYLQLAAGMPLLMQAISDVSARQINIVTRNLPSSLRYHPTLLSYSLRRICNGVR